MLKYHEVELQSGKRVDCGYVYYKGRKASYDNPPEAPEIILYKVSCADGYVPTDEEYEEIGKILLWWEERRVTHY